LLRSLCCHPSTQPHYGPELATGRSLTKPLTLKHLGMDGRFNPVYKACQAIRTQGRTRFHVRVDHSIPHPHIFRLIISGVPDFDKFTTFAAANAVIYHSLLQLLMSQEREETTEGRHGEFNVCPSNELPVFPPNIVLIKLAKQLRQQRPVSPPENIS
jgi:hypothetical protein